MKTTTYIFVSVLVTSTLAFWAGHYVGSAIPAVTPPDICEDDRCLCDDSDEVAVAIARDIAGTDASDFDRILAFDGYREITTRHNVTITVRCGRGDLTVAHADTGAEAETRCYVDDICRAIERAKANAIAKAWAGEP